MLADLNYNEGEFKFEGGGVDFMNRLQAELGPLGAHLHSETRDIHAQAPEYIAGASPH